MQVEQIIEKFLFLFLFIHLEDKCSLLIFPSHVNKLETKIKICFRVFLNNQNIRFLIFLNIIFTMHTLYLIIL